MENGWKIADGKRIHHHCVLLGSRGGVRQVALLRSRRLELLTRMYFGLESQGRGVDAVIP
jgi:hypothetical protein